MMILVFAEAEKYTRIVAVIIDRKNIQWMNL
ncbi:hypothetical protein EZS27_011589 [termite gut metagenome]|jgi:hypothetical protein|uniref:Uncharacterized protein n=1 Tax=termite gut metagenome TaxID=433724 RepID=A0A5J4S2W7_9ZZZZ